MGDAGPSATAGRRLKKHEAAFKLGMLGTGHERRHDEPHDDSDGPRRLEWPRSNVGQSDGAKGVASGLTLPTEVRRWN